ncbi:MAG: BACON domain-containing protein [Alistipes sp.]|nr:BACON domain-containing protein [Alistipes sp.]
MKRFWLIIAIVAVCAGCQYLDKEIDKQPDNEIEHEPEIELEVDKSDIILDYKTQNVEIAVRANIEFDVDICVDWITYIIADSGDRVVLSVAENTTAESRSAEIVIIASDIICTVTVVQGVKPEMISLLLEHRSTHLEAPTWGGSDVKGVVDWGDGTIEEFREGMSHDYIDVQKHSAQFDVEGATSFHIERIGDIESVTISL